MNVALEIVPCSQSLDMYGEPDRSTAYSLSGHVSVKLSSASYYFARRQATHLLLKSLTIVFEGQTEMVSHEMGYSSCRLCSVSQELVVGEPVELSSEPSAKPCTWNVVFNLAVPGWLPATAAFGEVEDGKTGTRYALHAKAVFTDLDDGAGSSFLSALCFPFRQHTRTTAAPICDIPLNRIMTPPAGPSFESLSPPTVNYPIYTLYAHPTTLPATSETPRIPMEVIQNLRVIASVPRYIDMQDISFPLTLRLRAPDLPESESKRLRILSFDAEAEQMECYRSSPMSSYAAQFPLPPASEQPPKKPLLNPHPMQPIYELGLAGHRFSSSCVRSISMLPPDMSCRFAVSSDGCTLSQDTDVCGSRTWCSMQAQVPFAQMVVAESGAMSAVTYKLRESGRSPLYSIQHRLHVSLLCKYNLAEDENPEYITERLHFHVPIQFARILASSPVAVSRGTSPSPSFLGHSPSSSVDSLQSDTFLLRDYLPPASLPYAHTLPAYSQLFDTNGDRKIDYSVPLPLYTPPSSCHSDASSSVSSLDFVSIDSHDTGIV